MIIQHEPFSWYSVTTRESKISGGILALSFILTNDFDSLVKRCQQIFNFINFLHQVDISIYMKVPDVHCRF